MHRGIPEDAAALYLAAIVASSDDAIVSKDVNGVITSWNRGAERIFGFTADEAIGQSIRIIIPQDRQAEEDVVLGRIRKGEQVDHFETIRVRKDGTRVHISLTVSPIRDASGKVVGASKIARDIDFRKRAEAALVRAETARADLQRRLLSLVAASGSLLGSLRVQDVLPGTVRLAADLVDADGYAIWRFDPQENRWHVGASAGVSEEFAAAIVSKVNGVAAAPFPSTDPFVAEDVYAAPILNERRDAYRREGIQSLLAIPMTVSGEATASLVFYHHTRHAFSEVEIETARALGNLGAAALRTAELYEEQRHVQQQALFLAQATETLSASLEYTDTLKTLAGLAVPHLADWCAVDIVNGQGNIERLAVAHVDPAKVALAERFQERFPSSPTSQYSVAHVVRTGTGVMMAHVTDGMIVAGATSEEHLQAVRELGITSFMCVPLRTREGARGAITFVSAESGRRYTPADLRFAENVADRAGLAIDAARAYDEVRKANQLKDEFLATLSHELRTPLNAILGYARLLRTGVIPDDKRESALDTVERNAASLAQIVEDVLDVSRIVAAKLRLNVEPVELASVVDEAIATMIPAADAKGLHVRTAIDRNTGVIAGDAERLRQVFWNLLSNAVKFTPAGGEIVVALTRAASHVEIAVRDTGRGIASDFLPYVFDRFRQADGRFTREHGGLGLGLSIAQHLVELHGGTIRVESAGEGQGATFLVTLPLRREVPESRPLAHG